VIAVNVEDDLFGLQREQRILESGVRDAFTPHQPIDSLDFFFGRQREVQNIVEQINTPGQHSLLYGERGVGKSSLANVASKLLLRLLVGKLYVTRCDSKSSFASLLRQPLLDVGIEIDVQGTDTTTRVGGRAGVRLPFAEATAGGDRSTTKTRMGPGSSVSPSSAAEALSDVQALLLVDEADAIRDSEDRSRLAEFVKLLSDFRAKFKVLIVGVSTTGGDLVAGHPSVSRCLRETHLGRMPDDELSLVLTEGARVVELEFESPAIRSIVYLSAGYPHFTHLLGLKCAEDAIAEGYSKISVRNLKTAMESAVRDAEGTLVRTYKQATRSHSTDMYGIILLAAANLDKPEFTARDLRESLYRLTGQDFLQNTLNNYYQRLVSDGSATILCRAAKGIYRFNDPRMPSYIKIAHGAIDS